jgi:hypothetical protein
MTTHDTTHFHFELDDSHLTIEQTKPIDGMGFLKSIRVPKTEFGQALVGLGVVHIATVQHTQEEDATKITEEIKSA